MDKDAPKTADQKPEPFAFAPPPMTSAPTYQTSESSDSDGETPAAQTVASTGDDENQGRFLERLKTSIYQLADPAYADYEDNSPDPFDMDETESAAEPVAARQAKVFDYNSIQPFTQNQQIQTGFSHWWS